MKKKVFQLHMPTPCDEGWQNMSPTERGAFCASCKKEVIDFTQKTPYEIANHFANQNGKTCGRFYLNQLNETYTHYEVQKQNNLKYAAGLALGLLVSKSSFSQEDIKPKNEVITTANQIKPVDTTTHTRIISGIVKDVNGEPLIGVNVSGKGTTIGAVTDIDGKYILEIPKTVTTLMFTYVGYKNLEKPILSLNMDAILSEEDVLLEGEVVITRVIYDPVYSPFQRQNPHWRKRKK